MYIVSGKKFMIESTVYIRSLIDKILLIPVNNLPMMISGKLSKNPIIRKPSASPRQSISILFFLNINLIIEINIFFSFKV